ncbi:MAG: DUF2809 domain-containing protein [Chloroflexi bacterium]|nr:DUF2809 domain-containing protein [Chloroflexota bacterium]
MAYAGAAIAVVVLGLASRSPAASALPSFVKEYAGDTLWALVAFLAVRFLAPALPIGGAATLALTGSFLVELSQLYQAPWLNALRATRLGHLILGQGFLWSDLLCYGVGVVAGSVGETFLRRRWWARTPDKSRG